MAEEDGEDFLLWEIGGEFESTILFGGVKVLLFEAAKLSLLDCLENLLLSGGVKVVLVGGVGVNAKEEDL